MDFYNERVVKNTRKDHKCFGCLVKLPIGSNCSYISGVYQGDFGAYYLCNKCKDYLDDNPEVAHEGYCEGDIRAAMLEDEEWNKQREQIL